MCDIFLQKLIDNMNNLDFSYYLQPISNNAMKNILGENIITRTNNDLNHKHNNTYIAIDLFENRWKKKSFIVKKGYQTIYIEFNYINKEERSSFKHIINFMMIYIHQIESLFLKSCPEFRIIFYLSDEKKRFVKQTILNQEVIKCDNVNSGVTFFYQDLPLIVIYRKEELLKVLIHELLHLYETHPIEQYDIYYDDYCKNNWRINRSGSLNLYEGYVETLAVIMHSFIYTYCIHKNKTTIAKIKKGINKEINYSNNLLNDIRSLQKNNYLNEETNVFSYFYVKTALIQDLDSFFSSIDPINYCIHDNYKQSYFNNILNRLISLKPIKQNPKNIKRTHFRMTISNVIS